MQKFPISTLFFATGVLSAIFSTQTCCYGHSVSEKTARDLSSSFHLELQSPFRAGLHGKNYRSDLLHRLATLIELDPSLRQTEEKGCPIVVILEIRRNGKPASCVIESSEADKRTNEVLRTILLAGSYDPLPSWFTNQSLRFRIKFASYITRKMILMPNCSLRRNKNTLPTEKEVPNGFRVHSKRIIHHALTTFFEIARKSPKLV